MKTIRPLPMLLLAACLSCVGLLISPAHAQPAGGPAVQAPAQPGADLCKSAVDPYDSIEERVRFLVAAGVDNELDEQEFLADRARANPFVRRFDRWTDLLRFDKDANKTIDWFEAEAYRQALRKVVLEAFDANKDGRLAGKERDAANEALAGRSAVRLSLAPGDKPTAGKPDEKDVPPQYRYPDYKTMLEKYDKDGDGKLSAQESEAMQQDMDRERAAWEMDHFDKDHDGKLSREERRAMAQAMQEWSQRQQKRTFQQVYAKYDKDGDGKLNAEESKAYQEDQWKQAEKANWEHYKKYDTDGDGTLSAAEREAMQADWRKQSEKAAWSYYKKYDKDGDGELSAEERKEMQADQEKQMAAARESYKEQLKKSIAKWDKDGDGELNEEERKAQMEEYRKQAEEAQEEYLRKWDANGNGRIDYAEQKAMMEGYRRRWERQQKEMDLDGDGRVSPQEYQAYQKKLLEKYDADGDGKLSPEEWKAIQKDQEAADK